MEQLPETEKWTREAFIDDILGHLAWPQGIYGVDCLSDIEYGPFDTLIRIEPRPEYGELVRLAMKTRFTSEEAADFDKRFEDDDSRRLRL